MNSKELIARVEYLEEHFEKQMDNDWKEADRIRKEMRSLVGVAPGDMLNISSIVKCFVKIDELLGDRK